MLNKLVRNSLEQQNLVSRVNRFMEDGYTVFDSIINKDQLQKFRQICDKVYLESQYDQNIPFISTTNVLNIAADLGPLVRFQPVYSFIRQLFGPDVILLSNSMRYCKPGTPNQAWHIDYRRDWPISRPENPLWSPFPTVLVAYYLDTLTLETGPFWVVPGSHKRIKRPVYADTSVPGELPILANEGSAIAFDARLWHRGGGNFSNSLRRALFFDYSLSWVVRKNKVEGGIVQQAINEHDSEMMQLLGIEANDYSQ